MRALPKDIIRQIARSLGRYGIFAFSSLNQEYRQLFREEREKLLKQGKIILGDQSSFFLSFEGELYASGWNFYGQLGVGDKVDRHTWTKAGPIGKKVLRVVNEHSITAAFCVGGLYACGLNHLGQLGLGDKSDIKMEWVKIGPAGKKVLDIKPSSGNTFLLCEDGCYGCGGNWWGTLGMSNTQERLDWVEIKISDKKILDLIPSEHHTFARCEDGWYVCGLNYKKTDAYVLFLGWNKIEFPGKTISKLISKFTIFIACEDGWYARKNEDSWEWSKIESPGKNILELFANDECKCMYAHCEDGWYGWWCASYSFGEGSWSKFELGNEKILDVKNPSCGLFFLRCEGFWYGSGSNFGGQLGLEEVEHSYDYWVKMGPAGKKVFSLFSKNNSTYILCDDGWYACGANDYGVLACGDTKERKKWIKVPLPQPVLSEMNSETETLKMGI